MTSTLSTKLYFRVKSRAFQQIFPHHQDYQRSAIHNDKISKIIAFNCYNMEQTIEMKQSREEEEVSDSHISF